MSEKELLEEAQAFIDETPGAHWVEEDSMTAATATETKTFTVDELVVSVKTGKTKKGQDWTRYGALLEGEDDTAVWGGTFDAGIGGQLTTYKGKSVTVTAEKDGQFWNITNIEPATTTTGTTETTLAAVPDWEDIGFRKTLSQQYAALLNTDAAVTALTTGDATARAAAMAAITVAATNAAVSVVTFEKPKTGDDIPF